MSEVNYSKKQIEPLIKKYCINPETNKLFQGIINLFADTPNYQAWAVKSIFSKAILFPDLVDIKKWADENKNLIKSLSKKNIIAYSSPSDFELLKSETEGLSKIAFVKSCIVKFNTAQKHMLEHEINLDTVSSVSANNTRSSFGKWYTLFSKFSKLSENRQKKFISLCSAFTDVSALKDGLEHSIEESYMWDKNDFLAFVANNTPDCKVVFDMNNILILQIPSFEDSRKLCGGGRTGWCITREESYFDNYVTSHHNPPHTQYFLFNFNKPEKDEFAHIGFTVEDNSRVCNAHSNSNQALLGDGIPYRGKQMNLFDAFNMFGVKLSSFFKINKLTNYKWDIESVANFVKKNDSHLAIAYSSNNRVVIKALDNDGLRILIGHTKIRTRDFSVSNRDDGAAAYVMLDLNLEYNDDRAVVMVWCGKDEYGILSVADMYDTYGNSIKKSKYLASIGIQTNDFINRENVKPEILLHKYIDEGDEQSAIDLINEQGVDFDVNYDFNERIPVYSAITNKMYNLFKVIVNHKKFDSSKEDGFGETLLCSLLYVYKEAYDDASVDTDINEKDMESMIGTILESENFDFNSKDISCETATSIAAYNKRLNWVLKALVSKPNVDINVVNDFNKTALTNAIENRNIEGIKILATRSDLVVRDVDQKIAKRNGIDLDGIIRDAQTTVINVGSEQPKGFDYAKIFKNVFSTLND